MTNKSRKSLSTMMCLLLFSAIAGAQQPAPQQAPTGVISLYFANGTPQCTFPVVSGYFRFTEKSQSGESHCKPLDGGGYIQLRDVPSATIVAVVNGRPKRDQSPVTPKLCGFNDTDAFNWARLKTIKQPTTTPEKLRIQDFETLQVGDVIVPGVRLDERQRYGHLNPSDPNTINCLIIEVSP